MHKTKTGLSGIVERGIYESLFTNQRLVSEKLTIGKRYWGLFGLKSANTTVQAARSPVLVVDNELLNGSDIRRIVFDVQDDNQKTIDTRTRVFENGAWREPVMNPAVIGRYVIGGGCLVPFKDFEPVKEICHNELQAWAGTIDSLIDPGNLHAPAKFN